MPIWFVEFVSYYNDDDILGEYTHYIVRAENKAKATEAAQEKFLEIYKRECKSIRTNLVLGDSQTIEEIWI